MTFLSDKTIEPLPLPTLAPCRVSVRYLPVLAVPVVFYTLSVTDFIGILGQVEELSFTQILKSFFRGLVFFIHVAFLRSSVKNIQTEIVLKFKNILRT